MNKKIKSLLVATLTLGCIVAFVGAMIYKYDKNKKDSAEQYYVESSSEIWTPNY